MRDRRSVQQVELDRGALGAHLSAMLVAARRPRARQRRRRALPRPRARGLLQGLAVLAPRTPAPWGASPTSSTRPSAAGASRRSAPRTRCSSSPRAAEDVAGLARRRAPRAAGDERRRADRDLQGGGRPARLRRALRARGHLGHARPRPHPDGDREPGDHRALAPLLDRARPLPGPQRVALEPQPAAHVPAPARGSASRPTTTPRSRPATSPGACPRATTSRRRSAAASTTSTASTRSRSAPPTVSRCCATRSRASRR